MTPSFLTLYFCGSEHCTPGHSYGPAVRPHYLLHVILQGHGRYQYKGETYALQAGDAFLISPAEVTYYQADEVHPWSYAWVGFDGQAVPEILSRTVFSVSCIFQNPHPDTLPSLAGCMEQLLETFRTAQGQSLASCGLLLQLFSFMRLPSGKFLKNQLRVTSKKQRNIWSTTTPIPSGFRTLPGMPALTVPTFIGFLWNRSTFLPKQYLLRHRLRIAVEMLCTTEYSITEIAFSCGFQDASSFSSCFQKQFHVSPRTFRKNTKTT